MDEFTLVLISVREPYNKNTLWIYPIDNEIEFKVFDKGWRVIASTKDLGLSNKSKQEVIELVTSSENSLGFKINKLLGQYKNSIMNLMNKNKELEQKIFDLENKIDKLTKRYGALLVK